MTAVLYAIPASHPCAAVEAALRLKDVPYRRVDLLPLVSRLVQRRRFERGTVPAVAFADGARVVGSRAILRALDERVPAGPLLPPEGDPAHDAVERAEAWGEEVLQPLARRLIWAALRRAPGALGSYAEGARLPVPAGVAGLSAPLVARLEQRLHGAGDLVVRADLLHLDSHLRRVEGWIDQGTLGGAAPNAADLQIGASLRLLLTIEDVAELLGDRPAAGLARRWFPAFPGRVPAGALPAAWLDDARGR
ncbi:MAG TPA: glutathione S-transferase N-terminal domain-containing protein [Solirubrobacteraceae bacterium]|nr:glutathione S-transferase N-terminal domain-containing protein [Solirubrobacteraceae bacterium]